MRKCNNWLDSYMLYSAPSEAPDSFHTWCGLSAIATALQRKVYFDMKFFKIFTNMYIVLVAPAGRARKTSAILIALGLINELPDVHISADATTREALIRAIKLCERIIDPGNGKMYTHSSITVYSKELSVFLGTGNHDLLSLLTDLYDSPDRWEYRTKNSGIDNIYGVWLNILAASTPSWLVGSIPITAIGGGFTSRVIFIVENDVRHRNPFPELNEKLKADLISDLEIISTIAGSFSITAEARDWFKDWYLKSNIPIDDLRFSGYSERRHIHLKKVAMLISVCKNSDKIITLQDIKEALNLINQIEKKMLNAFGSTGRNPFAPDIGVIVETIKNAGGWMRRSDMIRGVWRDVNTRELDGIMTTLDQMGIVKTRVGAGGTIVYELREATEDKSSEIKNIGEIKDGRIGQ